MQAKGPNALNMNAYVNADDSQVQYADEGTSSRPNIDNAAIEQQFDAFVKDMQKYDRILSDVAKHIEEIDGDGQFITDFYPKFISEATYEQDHEKRIVANTDPDLAKIIFNLQRNNRALKGDMRSWVLEFAKTAKLTEVLIGENKVLRQSIAGKNREIVKLIQGIGQAENEEVAELEQGLELLREENGVLREHLLKLKEEAAQKQREQQRAAEALQQAKKEFANLQREKQTAQDEEEHLSKTYQLVEQWRAQSERTRRKLQRERVGLLSRKQQLQDERERIERELNICAKDKQELEGGLKRDYQEQEAEKYRLIEMIHQLGDRISRQKEEGRYYDEEIARNSSKRLEYERIAKEYCKKSVQNQEQLASLKAQLATLQDAEASLCCQAELERYDIELLAGELKELEEKEKRQAQEWKQAMKEQQEQREKEIASWRSKRNEKQREFAKHLQVQVNHLAKTKRELQAWQEKVYEKKEELTDLKAHLKEVKENQIKLAELKSKLHAEQANNRSNVL